MDYYSKSGRQPLFKLLLSGLLFMVFGNLLCTIVTVSTAPFMNFEFFKVIVFILTLIIFKIGTFFNLKQLIFNF